MEHLLIAERNGESVQETVSRRVVSTVVTLASRKASATLQAVALSIEACALIALGRIVLVRKFARIVSPCLYTREPRCLKQTNESSRIQYAYRTEKPG